MEFQSILPSINFFIKMIIFYPERYHQTVDFDINSWIVWKFESKKELQSINGRKIASIVLFK